MQCRRQETRKYKAKNGFEHENKNGTDLDNDGRIRSFERDCLEVDEATQGAQLVSTVVKVGFKIVDYARLAQVSRLGKSDGNVEIKSVLRGAWSMPFTGLTSSF